jgi:uncharacterized protein (DUF58 family)
MLSAEVIARIKALDLRGRHVATDLMSGDYASAFHGRGMEFHEVREYVPGDDVRGIDWNVTARMNQPFIKVFREERELTIMLLVDVSASLASGLTRSRREAAAELAAVLAWLAIRGNDRVGLMLFGSGVELFVPPRKGQGHVWRIIRDVLTWSKQGTASNIDGALDQLAKMVKRRAVCFVISDFLTGPIAKALGRVARQHDVTCVHMGQDPLDGAIAADGGTLFGGGVSVFVDRETGELIELDTSNKSYRLAIVDAHRARIHALEETVRKSGADLFTVHSNESVVDPLATYLRQHQGGRRRS